MHPYTFDTFVTGANSSKAVGAAMNAATEGSPNPLVLFGPMGCGKTHLLHAIATVLRARRPEARVLLMPMRDLVDQLVHSFRTHEPPEFAGADAILLDDVRFEPSRPATRTELLQRLPESAAQVVVAADEALPMAGATNVELAYPDLPARVEIARRVAERRGLQLSGAALEKFARSFTGSPRALQSAITRIAAHLLVVS